MNTTSHRQFQSPNVLDRGLIESNPTLINSSINPTITSISNPQGQIKVHLNQPNQHQSQSLDISSIELNPLPISKPNCIQAQASLSSNFILFLVGRGRRIQRMETTKLGYNITRGFTQGGIRQQKHHLIVLALGLQNFHKTILAILKNMTC